MVLLLFFPMTKALLMEFIGTFFLMLVVAISGNAIAAALMLTLMIYIGVHVSGGQYNPAVTFALFVAGKLAHERMIPYIIVQFLAGIAAMGVFAFMGGKNFMVRPAENALFLQAVIAEILFTFTLVLTVFMTMIDKKSQGNSYFGLAVGLNVVLGAFAVGGLSGGVFNPVVGIAPQLFRIFTGNTVVLEAVALYAVAPVIGGLMAAVAYKMLVHQEVEHHEKKEDTKNKHHHASDLDVEALISSAS